MNSLSEAKTSAGGLVTLRTVMRLRLFFGFYSNISGNASLNFLYRLYCFSLSCTIFTAYANHIYDVSFAESLFSPMHIPYFVTSLVGLVTGENYFFEFCREIEEVDKEMGFDDLPFVTPTVQYIVLFFFVFRSISVMRSVLQCILLPLCSNVSVSHLMLFNMTGSALSFSILTIIMSLDLLRNRLNLLRNSFNCNLSQIDCNRSSQIKTIYDCLNVYKTLIDHLHASFPWMKLQICLQLIASFASFIIHSQESIEDIIRRISGITNFLTIYIQILISCMIVCLMPLFGELVIQQVDNFKISIADRILECRDEEVYDALELAGQYLEDRPFKVTFFRVCALDGSLILSFIGLTSTYLISTIQISGLI